MQMMPPPGAPAGAHVVYMQPPPGAPQAVYMQPPPGAPQAVYMQPPPGAHYPAPPPQQQQQPAGMFPAPGQMLMQAAQRRAPAMFGTGQPSIQQHPPQPGR